MVVSKVNNYETISFLTSDIASKTADTRKRKVAIICTNKLNASYEHQKWASSVLGSMIHQQCSLIIHWIKET